MPFNDYKVKLDLKQRLPHLFLAWLLLVFFVAGQVVIYTHSHQSNRTPGTVQHSTSHQTLSEKCQLCDAMHHNAMVVNVSCNMPPAAVSRYHYKTVTYRFIRLSLILSTGRAPPVSNFLT